MASFFTSLLLSTCLIGHVSAHSLVKRKASGDKLYALFNRASCVAVKSEDACPVNWKLPPEHAFSYKAQAKATAGVVKLYDIIGASTNCKAILRATLCSQASPRCLPDGGKDYGDARTRCEQLYTSCPSSVADNLIRRRFCEQIRTGKYEKSACVSPDGPIGGVCPQPKYKMPADLLQDYKSTSLANVQNFKTLEDGRYSNGERIYSTECVELVKDFTCRPFYCSKDEQRLLVEHDYSDCIKAASCLNEPLRRLSNSQTLTNVTRQLVEAINAICNVLPRRSLAQLETPAKLDNSGVSAIAKGQLRNLLFFVVPGYLTNLWLTL